MPSANLSLMADLGKAIQRANKNGKLERFGRQELCNALRVFADLLEPRAPQAKENNP